MYMELDRQSQPAGSRTVRENSLSDDCRTTAGSGGPRHGLINLGCAENPQPTVGSSQVVPSGAAAPRAGPAHKSRRWRCGTRTWSQTWSHSSTFAAVRQCPQALMLSVDGRMWTFADTGPWS